ncbi:MAG: hypothetical protein WKF83_14905 [Nocardioidaceae bacterium]
MQLRPRAGRAQHRVVRLVREHADLGHRRHPDRATEGVRGQLRAVADREHGGGVVERIAGEHGLGLDDGGVGRQVGAACRPQQEHEVRSGARDLGPGRESVAVDPHQLGTTLEQAFAHETPVVVTTIADHHHSHADVLPGVRQVQARLDDPRLLHRWC